MKLVLAAKTVEVAEGDLAVVGMVVGMVADIVVVEEGMTEEAALGEAQGEVAEDHRDCCCTSGLYFPKP